MTTTQNQTVQLAFGRILRIGSRPTQPGDVEEYERCRNLIMSILADGEDPVIDVAPELRGRQIETPARPEPAPQPQVYNPQYLAYCTAHGRTPAAMMAHDRERFPGGCMAGYIVWVSQQKETSTP